MRKKDKIIFARETKDVWLRVGRLTWSDLPLWIKNEILEALDRIASIRSDIACHAKVQSMPPVIVVPQIWAANGGLINGRTAPLQRPDRAARAFGAQLPILTALCKDAMVVRRIMLYEYLHCFYFNVSIIEARGEPLNVSHDVFSASDDAAIMERPSDWFSSDDANEIVFHNDPSLAATEERITELRPFFPVTVPEFGFRITRTEITPDVQNHIRQLLQARNN
jgi:hypothetical protein